eukprot:Em0002g831a
MVHVITRDEVMEIERILEGGGDGEMAKMMAVLDPVQHHLPHVQHHCPHVQHHLHHIQHHLCHVQHHLRHVQHHLPHVQHHLRHIQHHLRHIQHHLRHIQHHLRHVQDEAEMADDEDEEIEDEVEEDEMGEIENDIRDMRAGAYEEHECVLTLTASEERAAAGLLKRAISTSSKGIIQLGTGGTPNVQEPSSQDALSCRPFEGGQPSVFLQNEVLSLGDEQRRALLKEAGISDEIKIGPAEVLAIKVGLAIPWNKIRILRRWLKASNISLACEERMHHASRKAVGENLKGELAPFSLMNSLPSGGEEFQGAPLVFIPDLILKVVELLEENDHAGRLTWHNGVIPASEIWIKLGGDKGGGTFKMNFQIVNVSALNFVNNTCVFCCFEADDSYTSLHIALERYKEQVEHLQGMTWSLGLELAFYHTEVDQSRYSLYSQELQRLHKYKVELQEAKQSEAVLQQLATYMAVLIGESFPLTADLLHQSANTSKIVKQLETKIAASTAVFTREFPLNEGPFVKELDMALQSIGVHRQQYFGGTFVGNHVHETQSVICKLAESSLPQKSEMVATRTMILKNAFSKFAKCHSIYDQNFIDESQVHEQEQSVQEFMEFFQTNFPKGTIPIKMHMVEDHAMQWSILDVGFGLLGEQGAESIHAKFNNLARAYSAIKGKVHQLKCTVAEHLVSIAPHNVAAIPPPKKRKK